MIARGRIWLLALWVALALGATSALASPAGNLCEGRDLVSIPWGTDTLFVRGRWCRDSSNAAAGGWTSYRIEDRTGRLRAADSLSPFVGGEYSGEWCDLDWRVDQRGDTKFVILSAACYPAYPEAISEFEYVALRGDRTVRSKWSTVDWQPSTGNRGALWVGDASSCLEYSIPILVSVGSSEIRFAPAVQSQSHGGLLLVAATLDPCLLEDNSGAAVAIRVFDSKTSEHMHEEHLSLGVYGSAVTVRRAWVRVRGSNLDELSVVCERVEASIGERTVYLRPEEFSRLGFESP
jgi:hypothetical protein